MKIILQLIVIIALSAPALCHSYVGNIENMKKLADGGNSYAQYEVGKWLLERGDSSMGYSYLNRACGNKYFPACDMLKRDADSKLKNIEITSSNSHELFDKALSFYKDKQYHSAFPVFSKLCDSGMEVACLYMGRSYAHGLGTVADPKKARAIFQKYSDRHDVYKIEEAWLLEYKLGELDENVDQAMSFYSRLQNSSTDWIADDAKAGLKRLPIYIFMNEYLPIHGRYISKKLDYDRFYRLMFDLNLNQLPSDLSNSFYDMRDICMKVAKNNDSFWASLGMSAAKSFVSTWTTGIFGLAGSVIDGFAQDSQERAMAEECERRTNTFFNILNKYELSNRWLNAKVKAYYPDK